MNLTRVTQQFICFTISGACCSLVASCKPRVFHENSARTSAIGGEPLPPDHPGATSAVLVNKNNLQTCSGVLIGRDLVLTAGVCVHSKDLPDPLSNFIKVRFFKQDGSTEEVDALSYQPFYQEVATVVPSYDIGFIILKSPAPAEFSPIPIASTASMPTGTAVDFVGFGRTDGSLGATGYPHKVTGTIEQLLDEPLRRSLFTVQGEGAGICHGDAGAPAYVETNNGWALAGIAQFYDPTDKGNANRDDIRNNALGTHCSSGISTFTIAAHYLQWITTASTKALIGVAETPARPAPTAPLSLSGWCRNWGITPDQQKTLLTLAEIGKTFDCDLLEKALANTKSLQLAPIGPNVAPRYTRKLTNADPLTAIPNLEEINFSDNALTNISSIAKIKTLKSLNLTRNLPLKNLNELNTAPSLQNLNVSGIPALNLDGIKGMLGLKWLNIADVGSRNTLLDLSLFASLTSLQYLDISGWQLPNDTTPLLSLPNLQEIRAERTALTPSTLNALLKHKTLKTVYLKNSDLETLYGGKCPFLNTAIRCNWH